MFKGRELADYRGKKIGYLFQDFELLDNMTAKENILLPLSLHGISGQKAKEPLEALARQLDIFRCAGKISLPNVRRTEAESSSGKGADRKSQDPFGR